jgi:uncharacterized protein
LEISFYEIDSILTGRIFMLEFKKLTLEDKPLIDGYIKPFKFLTSEYSFTTLYIWRKALDIEYSIYQDSLIIKKVSSDFGSFFMQPIGFKKESLPEILKALIEYKSAHNMEYLFRNIEAPFIEILKILSNNNFIYGIEENNFDYIYESEKLINLPGRKLSSKRNHFTRFINGYNYRVEEITLENTQKCIEASEDWCEKNGCVGMLSFEMNSILDMLHNRKVLDFIGMVVYVDDTVSAFSIGEIVNDEMAIIHIEKAFSDVHGLYTFINRTFAEKYFKNIKYINREDDMGLEGLRKAKQSYHPYKLEYKHTVKLG